jgi:hypothetical protein
MLIEYIESLSRMVKNFLNTVKFVEIMTEYDEEGFSKLDVSGLKKQIKQLEIEIEKVKLCIQYKEEYAERYYGGQTMTDIRSSAYGNKEKSES